MDHEGVCWGRGERGSPGRHVLGKTLRLGMTVTRRREHLSQSAGGKSRACHRCWGQRWGGGGGLGSNPRAGHQASVSCEQRSRLGPGQDTRVRSFPLWDQPRGKLPKNWLMWWTHKQRKCGLLSQTGPAGVEKIRMS